MKWLCCCTMHLPVTSATSVPATSAPAASSSASVSLLLSSLALLCYLSTLLVIIVCLFYRTVFLNGKLLELKDNYTFPDIQPMQDGPSPSFSLPPLSFGFIVFLNAKAKACHPDILKTVKNVSMICTKYSVELNISFFILFCVCCKYL